MHYFAGTALLFLTGVCLVTSKFIYERNDDDASATRTVSEANEKFSFDLLKAIGNDKKNMVASPLSLHVILGFLSQGAEGTTKKQILNATYLTDDDNVTQAGFKSLLTSIHSTSAYTLDLGDAAFIEKTFPVKSSFQNVARSSFLADTNSVDFATNVNGAIDTINQWVESRTNGQIKNLVTTSDVNSETKFLLANTVYFKGEWENGFNSSLTKKSLFYVDSQTSVQTDVMTTTAVFNYTVNKDLDAKVLALDYKGKEARLLIVLPNEVDGLSLLESKITSLDLIKAKLSPKNVEVTLPKFKIEQEIKFRSILQKLGITAVFIPESDLKGISDTAQLIVDEVKQKAVIEVNEEGTIAAAATETGGPTAVLTYDFLADHGFLYFLEHIPTNSVLMYGRYIKP